MFTGEHNRKRYTAGDIHRYHSGLMSPAERNALEKAALEDPFLEEALEGYAHAADPTNDLTILRSRLDERVRRKRGALSWSLYAHGERLRPSSCWCCLGEEYSSGTWAGTLNKRPSL